MKKIKKIIAALLVILSVFSVFNFSAFAEEEETQGEITAEPAEEITEPAEEETFDVTMYICATANSFSGHVWLYFINNSDAPVTVGYLPLDPGKGMSVGSLSYTRIDGGGTYYNGEARMATKRDALDTVRKHTTSLSMSLTPEQLKTVSDKIKSKNFYSLLFDNCGMFASSVWNSVADKKVIHPVLPLLTVINMKLIGAKTGALEMQSVDSDNVYKQNKGTVAPATDKNFDTSSVTFF